MKKAIGTLALLAASAGALITPAVAAVENGNHPAAYYQTDNRARVDHRRDEDRGRYVPVRVVRNQHAWYDFHYWFHR